MRIGENTPVARPPASAASVVAVLQAPRDLSALVPQHSFTGVVVALAHGKMEIASNEGAFVLRSAPGLAPGTPVVLTLEQGEDGLLARLHQSPSAASEGSSAAAPAKASLSDSTASPPRHPASPPAVLDLSAAALPVGEVIGQRLPIKILIPARGAMSQALLPTPSPALSVVAPPLPSSDAAIRLLIIAAPSGPVAPSGSAGTFEATVAARRSDGIVLQSDDGPVLLLPPNLELSEGTRVVFVFEPAPAALDVGRPETPFEVLDSLLKLLRNGGAGGSRASIVRLLPRPNKALPALVAAFLGALRGGEPGRWLGPDASMRLAQDHPDIHDRLCAAWSQARVGEAEPKEWQTWTIPLLSGCDLSPLRVYRRRGDDAREAAGDDSTGAVVRVVFDCSFTRVGRVQVDTLCRKPRRCDIVIRTETALEPSVRDALGLAYSEAAAVVGLVGKLDFRAAKGAFVEPGTAARTTEPLRLSV